MRSQNAVLHWPFPQTGSCDTTKKLLHKHVSSSAEKFFPFLPFPASKPAMVALTEFRGRKTSPCKGATFGETGNSMASLGSLERGVRSPLGGRFCCGPAMHRWRAHCRCPDYTKPMIWCSPYHSSSTYIDCLAIIGWRVERVLYDTWCYMTSNEVNYN